MYHPIAISDPVADLPEKYYYSSGMDYSYGYKKSEQKYSKK